MASSTSWTTRRSLADEPIPETIPTSRNRSQGRNLTRELGEAIERTGRDSRVSNNTSNTVDDRLVSSVNVADGAPSVDIQAIIRRIQDNRRHMTAIVDAAAHAVQDSLAIPGITLPATLTVTATDVPHQAPVNNPVTAPHEPERVSHNEKSVLGEVLDRCVPPTSDELKDSDAACHLCQEIFLKGTDPEMPMKLPCGHIFGASCLLKWLSPLSVADFHNTCPMCRAPILEPRMSHIERRAIVRRRQFDEWQARWNTNASIVTSMLPSAWAIRGEELFVELCQEIVNDIVDPGMDDHQIWLNDLAPLMRIINFATLGSFVKWLEHVQISANNLSRGGWMLLVLPEEELQAIRQHLASKDRREWKFLEADEETFGRLAKWHGDIKESHRRLTEVAGHDGFM